MTVLAIYPAHNSPGKKDSTGAFAPEAREFVKLHGGKALVFDNRRSDEDRAREVLELLEAQSGYYAAIGLFVHGYRTGIQTGHHVARKGPRSVRTLAEALSRLLTHDGVVPLYACDTARDLDRDRKDDETEALGGVGGFASRLCGELEALLPTWTGHVDAHAVTAHTTRAPFVRRFAPRDGTDAAPWLAAPRSPLWAPFRRKLAKDRAFRLTFPLMSTADVEAALRV